MVICKTCGVELEEGLDICPLCRNTTTKKTDTQGKTLPPLYNPGYSPLNLKEKVRLFWELMALLHFSALVVTILIDIIANKKPSWSLFAALCLTSSFIYITLFCFTLKKLWVFLPVLLLNTFGFLVLLDLLTNGIDWFINPGLPLAGFFILILGIVLIISYSIRDKGFNIIAFASIAIGIYCILAETFINLAVKGDAGLSWSVIVAASILPFSLLLIFFHYRLKRGTSLRRFFHL